jgi:phosphoribosylpyrophosphate synthetase
VWFAIASVIAAIGAQEVLTTDLHESGEAGGF